MKRWLADDLYAVLGVSPTASANELRAMYEHRRRQADPRSPAFARAAQAYAILGDPRLRNEYDRGRTVGVGTGRYFSRTSGDNADSRVTPPSCNPSTTAATPRWSLVLLAVLGLLAMLVQTVQMPEVRALFDPGPTGATVPAAAAPAPTGPSADEPPGTPGTCLFSDASRQIQPGRTVPCDSSHLFEVTSVIDLEKLLGRAPVPSDDQQVHDVCDRAFTAYTGLLTPTPGLYPTNVTIVSAPPATSWALCLAGAHDPRTTTARDVAR